MGVTNLLEHRELWENEGLFASVFEGLKYFDSSLLKVNQVPSMLENSFFMADRQLSLGTTDNQDLLAEIDSATSVIKSDFPQISPEIIVFGTSVRNKFLIEKMNGVGGYAAGNAVLLYLQPNSNWRNSVYRTILHELNHLARYPFGHPSIFINWVVFEGLAELYVAEKCPNEPLSPWTKSATLEQIEKLLPMVRKFWTDEKMPLDSRDWFFGSVEKSIPLWFGYSLGFQIAQAYRHEHPNMSWQKLISIPIEEIAHRFF